ncbi:MAG: restriction endonuclease [Bacteroidales bacterium]|nr:restriction endonuclease [Bacteroidales bacterium]
MNPNTEFERFTQRIYQKLVNNDVLKPTTVMHNVKLKGKSGGEHQIDVYWEYEIAGNMHRVAIECKNYDSLVPVGKVRDFYGVLSDLNNVNGIMVSKKGFQNGAKKYATEYGISLKELRRPGWNEIIGSIKTVVHAETFHTLYLFDDEWVKEQNIDLDKIRSFYANLQFDKADYWKAATHLPIETKDYYIRNAKGKIISSREELEKRLPDNPEPGSEIIFPFEDGWVESRYWGPVRIREVKFEYESTVQETTMNLAADVFVEAILEDALGGKTDYVTKYY